MSAKPPVLRRLVNKSDFERLLSAGSGSRSAHFAVHHITGAPWVRRRVAKGAGALQLSTNLDNQLAPPVDKPTHTLWLGWMVPKRHARRAVTRNLLKRQMRAAVERHACALAPGLWLIRLRAPFASQQFRSARSGALAQAARVELDSLLAGGGSAAVR